MVQFSGKYFYLTEGKYGRALQNPISYIPGNFEDGK